MLYFFLPQCYINNNATNIAAMSGDTFFQAMSIVLTIILIYMTTRRIAAMDRQTAVLKEVCLRVNDNTKALATKDTSFNTAAEGFGCNRTPLLMYSRIYS